MRPFGAGGDLDLDFGQSDRPGLVTALLARCAQPDDPEFWWEQPVGGRTAALLRLIGLTDPAAAALAFSARCTRSGCAERYEFELALGALLERACVPALVSVALDAGRTVRLRQPTGADLRRWRETRPRSHEAAVSAILASLVVEGRVDVDDAPVLARALGEHDPLVGFSVLARCPACDDAQEVAIDLEAVALARLQARQQALLEDVHRLACRYGWSEAEILALPPARRARYLALIEAEA